MAESQSDLVSFCLHQCFLTFLALVPLKILLNVFVHLDQCFSNCAPRRFAGVPRVFLLWLLLIPFFYQYRENDLQKKEVITSLADARDATRVAKTTFHWSVCRER